MISRRCSIELHEAQTVIPRDSCAKRSEAPDSTSHSVAFDSGSQQTPISDPVQGTVDCAAEMCDASHPVFRRHCRVSASIAPEHLWHPNAVLRSPKPSAHWYWGHRAPRRTGSTTYTPTSVGVAPLAVRPDRRDRGAWAESRPFVPDRRQSSICHFSESHLRLAVKDHKAPPTVSACGSRTQWETVTKHGQLSRP